MDQRRGDVPETVGDCPYERVEGAFQPKCNMDGNTEHGTGGVMRRATEMGIVSV